MSAPTDDTPRQDIQRREFLRLAGLAGVGAGALLTNGVTAGPLGAQAPAQGASRARAGASGTALVIGAGVWGAFTAFNLAKAGVKVTLLDQYGTANSRATSGDETRGIRSSYGDRAASAELWTRWARESIVRWTAFDAEHAARFGTRFFIRTGDLILREKEEPFTTRTTDLWDQLRVPYEKLSADEAARRWPMIASAGYGVIAYEPDAGVARARASVQALVTVARDAGVELRIGRARPGAVASEVMDGVTLDDGTVLRADTYVFCCGPWLRKVFPEQLGNKMRTPLGHVCYFGTPVGDSRFTAPNIPSWNVPGVTGWGALPVDSRGFRVRGALAPPRPPRADDEDEPPPPSRPAPQDPRLQDPDLSVRWSSQERIDGSRRVLTKCFPAMAEAPLLETRACHYESSSNRNFIVDRLPGTRNVWVAGAGQAEGFKFAPLVGEYAARRIVGTTTDPALAVAFKFPTEEYEAPRTGEEEE
jgi:glycine/D-amino acid oxidase-like deaminating enzyme